MDAYFNIMDGAGTKILSYLDIDDQFSGHTKGWPLTEFRTAITIALAYVLFVVLGSAIMKMGVPALELYGIKFAYNFSQIFLCAYMTIEAVMIAKRNNYGMLCNHYNRYDPPMANILWLFYISKIWDFWDTFFIVTGKKWRQLSFLHVYHHFTVFLCYWINVNINYDGEVYLSIVLNGFIHTVMYTYYFICMHTKVRETGKSLPIWWKSSLTSMQMIQFVTMTSQASGLLLTGCKETNPKVFFIYFAYTISLLLLFAQFFVTSYVKRDKKNKIN